METMEKIATAGPIDGVGVAASVRYHAEPYPGGAPLGRVGGPIDRLNWADSYSRMRAVLDCYRRRDFWFILGHEWTMCDNIAAHKNELTRLIGARLRRMGPIWDAMTREEREHLESLPRVVSVWRGCYVNNVDGLSWSLDRDVAATFPSCRRYHQTDKQALLVEGRLRKSKIAFVKLDRNEREVVTVPDVVKQICHWFLDTEQQQG